MINLKNHTQPQIFQECLGHHFSWKALWRGDGRDLEGVRTIWLVYAPASFLLPYREFRSWDREIATGMRSISASRNCCCHHQCWHLPLWVGPDKKSGEKYLYASPISQNPVMVCVPIAITSYLSWSVSKGCAAMLFVSQPIKRRWKRWGRSHTKPLVSRRVAPEGDRREGHTQAILACEMPSVWKSKKMYSSLPVCHFLFLPGKTLLAASTLCQACAAQSMVCLFHCWVIAG